MENRSGAYKVRYHFVISGFSLAETGKERFAFFLGRALKVTIWNLFDTAGLRPGKTNKFCRFRGVTDPRLVPFWHWLERPPMAESCTSPRTRPSQRWFSCLGIRQTGRTKNSFMKIPLSATLYRSAKMLRTGEHRCSQWVMKLALLGVPKS